MLTAYGRIAYTLWFHSTPPGELTVTGLDAVGACCKRLDERKRVVRMLLVIVSVFAVSWFPFFTLQVVPPSLSSVFCCRTGSGYPHGYPVLGNSRGGFPLTSSQFVITYCDQSFPSRWHCLSAAPSLSGATLLSILEGVPLSATWGRGWSP